jgi:hypothetical protein
LISFLEAHPGNVFLYSDLTWLYGLSGRPSIGPVLWYHHGLTLPQPGDPALATVDQKLLHQLEDAHPGWVILDNREDVTYMGVRLEDFPLSRTWVLARRVDSVMVGGFRVWELGAGELQDGSGGL